MLSEFLDLERWVQWFSTLEREFIFLLALPFVVAIIGLWSAWVDKEEESPETAPSAPRPVAEPRLERRRRARRRGDVGTIAPHGSR